MKKTVKILAFALVAMAMAVACNNAPEVPADTIDTTIDTIDTIVEDTIDTVEEVAEEAAPVKKATTKKTTTTKKEDNTTVKGEAAPVKGGLKPGATVTKVTSKEVKTVADDAAKTPAPTKGKAGLLAGDVKKVN